MYRFYYSVTLRKLLIRSKSSLVKSLGYLCMRSYFPQIGKTINFFLTCIPFISFSCLNSGFSRYTLSSYLFNIILIIVLFCYIDFIALRYVPFTYRFFGVLDFELCQRVFLHLLRSIMWSPLLSLWWNVLHYRYPYVEASLEWNQPGHCKLSFQMCCWICLQVSYWEFLHPC